MSRLRWVLVALRRLSLLVVSGVYSVVVPGLQIAVGPLGVELGPQSARAAVTGSQAWPLRSVWDLPRPGSEPLFPALAGGRLGNM